MGKDGCVLDHPSPHEFKTSSTTSWLPKKHRIVHDDSMSRRPFIDLHPVAMLLLSLVSCCLLPYYSQQHQGLIEREGMQLP